MRKVIVGAFVSLDGVMQAPGGPHEDPRGGFRHGGWVAPWFDEALGGAIDGMMGEPFDLLLGRRTYDIFAAYWPYRVDDHEYEGIARKFQSCAKYVATHHPDTLAWEGSHSLGEDIVEGVRRLKAQDGPDLLTQGSTELLHQLFAADLVDRLQVMTFPVVLGQGRRLFDDTSHARAFKLLKSSTTGNGVTIALYERAGEVPTGDFGEDVTEAELERRRTLR